MAKTRPRARGWRQPRQRHSSARSRRALLGSLVAAPGGATPSLASLVADCDEGELVGLAISEGVATSAQERLGPLLSAPQRDRLSRQARWETMSHLAFLGHLAKLGAALDDAGLPWAVLKGPALVEISYRGVARGYSDLDLLVSPRDLGAAVDVLRAGGAGVPEGQWGSLLRDAKGELSLVLGEGPVLDLHWHVVFHRSARERFMISTEELLDRRRRVRLGGVWAWVLEPVDFSAHLALHASFQGAQRLRRLLDIERTLAHQATDWPLLVERCHRWKVGLPVGVLLNCARETLVAAVPSEVVRELTGKGAGHVIARQLSGWLPSGRLPGGRSIRTGLSRSLRDSLLTTSAQFASEMWAELGALVGTRSAGRHGRRYPEAGHDGAYGLEDYLDMVGSADRYGHLSLGPQYSPGSGAS